MHIRTTMRYNLTAARMIMIKKSISNKCWRGCGEDVEKRNLLHCWWECKLVQLQCKTKRRFLRNLRIELPYNPAILGIHPGKTVIQKDTCTPMFIAALFTRTKTQKQPKFPPIDKWTKIWYKYSGILLSHKNEMPSAATWMQL